MKFLKTSLLSLYASALAVGVPIALLAWNKTTVACMDRYLGREDQEEVERWIHQLEVS